MSKALTLIGVTMLAAGVTLPYAVGTAIPPIGYNILQLGGIGIAIIGYAIGVIGKRNKSS
jgi:hypothetical protein